MASPGRRLAALLFLLLLVVAAAPGALAISAAPPGETGARVYRFPRPPGGSFQDSIDRYMGDVGTPEVLASAGGMAPLPQPQEERINRIFKDLVRVAERLRPGLKYQWLAAAAEQPNAFALPGGRVFVTRGLLDLDLTDDELAGILAHELVHAAYSHGTRNLMLGLVINLFGSLILSEGGNEPAQRYAVGLVANLIANGYSREQEAEADRIGQGLAFVAGYSLDGLASALQKLSRHYGEGGAPPFAELFSDHPTTQKRVNMLNEQAKAIRATNKMP